MSIFQHQQQSMNGYGRFSAVDTPVECCVKLEFSDVGIVSVDIYVSFICFLM